MAIVWLCRQYLRLRENPNGSLDLNGVRKILLQKHKWSNEGPITPEDEFVLTILCSSDETIPTTSILSVLRILQQAGLLNGEDAKANFMAITQNGGRYADGIASALKYLNEAGLLNGEDAKANFMAITQNGGRYADGIASALKYLNEAGLLNREDAKANFKAITEGGGLYANDIRSALMYLNEAGLLTAEDAQANFKAITKDGGRYALYNACICCQSQKAGALTDENPQANFMAIIKDFKKYGKDISAAFFTLETAGLLTEATFKEITVYSGEYAGLIADALRELQKVGLLSGEHAPAIREAIFIDDGVHARDLATLFSELQEAGLLTGQHAEANLKTTIKNFRLYHYADYFASVLSDLRKIGLLTGEDGQANFMAIVESDWEHVKSIAEALCELQTAGLLSGQDGQANFMAIVESDWEHVKSIAGALCELQTAGLLSGEHAHANREEILRGNGENAQSIAWALCELQKLGLLSGEHAHANREEILRDNGENAESIAGVLDKLQQAGLLTSNNAQANFRMITGCCGRYAGDIGDVLFNLEEAGLLSDECKQKNFDLLSRYIRASIENNHGISFASKFIRPLLTQQRFSLLMLDESCPIGREELTCLAEIFSFDLPDQELDYKAINFWSFIKPMMHLREYIRSSEQEGEAVAYLRQIVKKADLSEIDAVSELLSSLSSCFNYLKPSFKGDDESVHLMMLGFLKMLATTQDPNSSFSGDVYFKINTQKNYDLLCQYIQLSMQNKHFIGFAAKCMKDNDLTQEMFSLLMLDETHPIGSDEFKFFAKIFSFDLPDLEPNYAAIDFWHLIRPMIHLREYIDSYLSDEEQREAIGYLSGIVNAEWCVIDATAEFFSWLCRNCNDSTLSFKDNHSVKLIMLAFLEMLAKSQDPKACLSEDLYQDISGFFKYDKFFSPKESRPSRVIPAPNEEKNDLNMAINERIMLLLYAGTTGTQSLELFKEAFLLLKNSAPPIELTRLRMGFSSSFFRDDKRDSEQQPAKRQRTI